MTALRELRSVVLLVLAVGAVVMLTLAPGLPLASGAVAALIAVSVDAWLDHRAELRRQRAENESVVKQLEELRAEVKGLREKLSVQRLASGLGGRT